MTNDLCSLSATELLALYRKRKLSPVEVVRATLERIEKLNPVLNAFCFLDPGSSLKEAKKSERRWLKNSPEGQLDGVPVPIKDLILTRGWPTLRGAKPIDPKGPGNDDAPAAARLPGHGPGLLGKPRPPAAGAT